MSGDPFAAVPSFLVISSVPNRRKCDTVVVFDVFRRWERLNVRWCRRFSCFQMLGSAERRRFLSFEAFVKAESAIPSSFFDVFESWEEQKVWWCCRCSCE